MCFAQKDEGNPVKKCKAMHEDKFRCSWLRNTVEKRVRSCGGRGTRADVAGPVMQIKSDLQQERAVLGKMRVVREEGDNQSAADSLSRSELEKKGWRAHGRHQRRGLRQVRSRKENLRRTSKGALLATGSNTKVWSIFRSRIRIWILICMRKRLVGMLWLRIGIVGFD